jgi:hypothetical protein
MSDDIVSEERTDEKIVEDIQNKINEVNTLLSEAYKHDLEIVIDQYNSGTLGSYAPYSNLEMRAKKLLNSPLTIPYTGSR